MNKRKPVGRPPTGRRKPNITLSMDPTLMERVRAFLETQPYPVTLTAFFEAAVRHELERGAAA